MSKKHFNYEPYIKSLINFMDKHIKLKPYPTIKLSKKNHGENNVLAPTGFYAPDSKTITIYTRKRAVKDCMRSIAHELIHHYQNLEGRLNDGAYNGQEIINDDKLMKLEEEAYLKGNILFRSWTEHLKQENEEKIEDKPTEHMRKLIKLDENQLKQIIKEYINENVNISDINDKTQVANISYNNSNKKITTNSLNTKFMDNVNNSETIEVPLKGGYVSYNITGIEGTSIMHYFKKYFQNQDEFININNKNYKLKMLTNEFNNFMLTFRKKIETVVEYHMDKFLKDNKDIDLFFDTISIYPVPSSSNFNEKMSAELTKLYINCLGKKCKVDTINPNVLIKDLRDLQKDKDFIDANSEFYNNTPMSSDKNADIKYNSNVISHVDTNINRFNIIYKDIRKSIKKLNKIYNQICDLYYQDDLSTNNELMVKLLESYFLLQDKLISNKGFQYYNLTTNTYDSIRNDKKFEIDNTQIRLQSEDIEHLKKLFSKQLKNIPSKIKTKFQIVPLKEKPFEIKNLPDSVRMGIKNIYNPTTNKKIIQKNIDKIENNLIIVFDDNISGGATLSDVVYQLHKLGGKYIIPITFGKMALKNNATTQDNKHIKLNTPQNGYVMPKFDK